MRENHPGFPSYQGVLWGSPGVPLPRMPAMATCWYCNSELPETSQYCPSCGHSQADRTSSPLFGVVDPTTGIWNSKFINALIGQEANRAVRYHRPLSVLVVELDHAEHIHKELEHIQVEGLLREISERLGQAIRDTDTVAFLDAEGPPHFSIVLPETDEQGATLAADKIRRSIATHDFSTAGNWQRITVSCGAATIGVLSRNNEEAGLMNRREYSGNLLREAYQALESGRSGGTNRTSVGALRSQ
jgi:diguanylate cyclase (GGDEF)-like protein